MSNFDMLMGECVSAFWTHEFASAYAAFDAKSTQHPAAASLRRVSMRELENVIVVCAHACQKSSLGTRVRHVYPELEFKIS